MTLDRAIDVFVQAFSQIKSRTHPYPAEQINGMWVLRDAPGRKDPRKIEVVTSGLEPKDVSERISKADLGWHFLCHIYPSESESPAIRTAYKGLGYRAISSEWMFIHDLQDIPDFDSDPPVRLVTTQAELDRSNQLASQKMKLMAGSRLFGVFDDKRDYGWVRSLPFEQDAWVSNLFVRPDSRRKGYGRALMSALLKSDRENGVRTSVLLASSSGAQLYPHLGYRQIGVLQMFCPADRSRFS